MISFDCLFLKMKNAISVDLEDWFCANNFDDVLGYNKWDSLELRLRESTAKILEILSKQRVRATFFVLGYIAERAPDLIKEIKSAGHEIASHGYKHQKISTLTEDQFDDDLKKSVRAIKGACGVSPVGYRAASFSITQKTKWALKILSKNGFKYDSSMFPTSFHPSYGAKLASLNIEKIDGIVEVPLSVVKFINLRIPFSGGAYFRILPYWLTKQFIKKINRTGRPYIFYIHPWELDTGQPKIRLSFLKRFRHYFNIPKTKNRLERLLNDFEFTNINEVIKLGQK